MLLFQHSYVQDCKDSVVIAFLLLLYNSTAQNTIRKVVSTKSTSANRLIILVTVHQNLCVRILPISLKTTFTVPIALVILGTLSSRTFGIITFQDGCTRGFFELRIGLETVLEFLCSCFVLLGREKGSNGMVKVVRMKRIWPKDRKNRLSMALLLVRIRLRTTAVSTVVYIH